jgi:A/G-specific adenine glycosylase
MPVDAAHALLDWYDGNARRLPWRAPPGAPPPDPYRVWLSEIMLQQTTVAAVRPYFAAFTGRWPTVRALAAAQEAEVMAAWAGLGYYARARNLIACAKAVVAGGGAFPSSEEGLRALPGIGAYTAAAIASIAFGAPAVAVDANVERVVARLFAVEEALPGARAVLHRRAASIWPAERAGDFAQAMMDLGSTICTGRAPACAICPLRGGCAAARSGDPARFPVKAAKRAKPSKRGTAFWLERDGHVLLCRRPPRGMLGGMRALPSGPWGTGDPGLEGAPPGGRWEAIGSVAHVFTHFSLDLAVVAAEAGEGLDGEWWPIARIEEAGLPTLFAKAAMLGRSWRNGLGRN